MNDIRPELATDLDALRLAKTQEETREKLAEEQRQQEQEAAVAQAARAWEREMKRTFKGILPHGERKRYLLAALEREEAEAA